MQPNMWLPFTLGFTESCLVTGCGWTHTRENPPFHALLSWILHQRKFLNDPSNSCIFSSSVFERSYQNNYLFTVSLYLPTLHLTPPREWLCVVKRYQELEKRDQNIHCFPPKAIFSVTSVSRLTPRRNF